MKRRITIQGWLSNLFWWGGGSSGLINIAGIQRVLTRILVYICYKKWRGYRLQSPPRLRRPCHIEVKLNFCVLSSLRLFVFYMQPPTKRYLIRRDRVHMIKSISYLHASVKHLEKFETKPHLSPMFTASKGQPRKL